MLISQLMNLTLVLRNSDSNRQNRWLAISQVLHFETLKDSDSTIFPVENL